MKKKTIIFTFRETREEKDNVDVINNKQGKKIFVFDVSYSERGAKTKIDDIIKATKIPEAIIEKAFATFKKQSEVDFFINKNAEKFLTEQLDMYLHQILLNEENKFDQKRLDQLKTIKTFALKIIKFISQFEDELVRVWNKPKFVLNSNYVITIDKLSDEILTKIAKHKNLPEQIAEWQELGMVDEKFDFTKRSEKEKFLPIDTKYFKDLEIEILSLFDNLDEALDGRLIHSENYQALNTLQEKYKEKVQCIYIDPPFNLDSSDQFLYRTNYKDANWATLLENRLRIAKDWLNEKGSIFVRCDYNGNWIVRCLMDEIFGKENFRNELMVNRGKQRFGELNKYTVATDTVFYFVNEKSKSYFSAFKRERYKNEAKGTNMIMKGDRFPRERKFIDPDGNEVILLPPDGRHWKFVQSKIDQMIEKGIIYLAKSRNGLNSGIKKLVDGKFVPVDYVPSFRFDSDKTIDSNWTDISGYSANWNFETENSEQLLQRILCTTSLEKDLVLDFFLGSGTTTAVAHKLGRKWIGVEMGEHFYNVVLPRMKKVLAYDKSGISKEVKEYQGGGFFKYYELEQYEDTLRNMKYKDSSPNSIFDTRKAFEQYVFYADEKFAHVLEVNKDKLEIDFDKLYPNIDFAETISNLLGLPIKKITKNSVVLQDGKSEKEIKTDYKNMNESEKLAFVRLLKPALWWGE